MFKHKLKNDHNKWVVFRAKVWNNFYIIYTCFTILWSQHHQKWVQLFLVVFIYQLLELLISLSKVLFLKNVYSLTTFVKYVTILFCEECNFITVQISHFESRKINSMFSSQTMLDIELPSIDGIVAASQHPRHDGRGKRDKAAPGDGQPLAGGEEVFARRRARRRRFRSKVRIWFGGKNTRIVLKKHSSRVFFHT